MSIGQRIKKLRKGKMNQSELAALVGVSIDSIRRWESNKRPPRSVDLQSLAEILNTSVAYLVEETDDPTPKIIISEKIEPTEKFNIKIIRNGKEYTEAELADKPLFRVANGLKLGEAETEKKEDDNISSNTTQIDDVVFVPIVSNKVITACCGNGSAYAEDVVWEYEGRFPVPAKVLMGYTWQGCSYKIMDAEGSSMEPYIYNGDKVLFVEYCEVGVGDIVVVSINNRLFIKGIVKMNEKELCLRAYNWQISPDMMVNLEGDTEVCILGKVINVVSARSIPKMI